MTEQTEAKVETPKTETKPLNFDISVELYDQIKAESDRLGLYSIAGFMRMLAVQYFEKKN